jgi:hypothetical protein
MTEQRSQKGWNFRKPPVSTPPAGNFVKRSILSANESEFHRLLIESAGNDYQVFPKIGLKDIIQPMDRNDFSRIQSKHVDFVITGNNGRTTIAAIELDDTSHNNKTNALHDAAKDFYLNSAGIPIVRIRIKEAQAITPSQLREKYLSAKADASCEYPIENTPENEGKVTQKNSEPKAKKGCAVVFLFAALILSTPLIWIYCTA